MKISNPWAIGALLVVVMTIAQAASAASVLDQSNDVAASSSFGIGFANEIERSQVFTTGTDGLLTQIDLRIDALLLGDGSADWSVSIYATNAGTPLESALATGIFSGSGVSPGWASFDVSSLGITAYEGTQLAFGVGVSNQTVSIPGWSLFLDTANNYSGGNTYVRSPPLAVDNWTLQNSDYDMLFRTYMDSSVAVIPPVPVPAAVWLFGSALGLLGWMRRKTA